MKWTLLLLTTVVFALACTNAVSSENEEHLKVVGNYIDAVQKMDFDAMNQYLADDYMGMGPSFGDTIYREAAIANWKENVTTLYDSIRYQRSRMVAANIPDGPNKGNWVVNWAELHIRYKTGEAVNIWANTSYLVENGKIKRSITVYNEADALRQQGYIWVKPEDLQP